LRRPRGGKFGRDDGLLKSWQNIPCAFREMANSHGMKRRATKDEKPANRPEVRQWLHQAHVFKALGHFGRMAIVHALAGGELCACELAKAAGCSPSTASRHLLVLRHAGLIIDERRGQQIFYRLTCPCVLTFAECLNRIEAGENVKTLRVACCA
jgi:ArsR family transcriptional regulator